MTIDRELTRIFLGSHPFIPEYKDPNSLHSLHVSIACQLQSIPTVFQALLDTGAYWSVLPSAIARTLGFDLSPRPTDDSMMTTREGLLKGSLETIQLRLAASYGDSMDLDAVFLVPKAYESSANDRIQYASGWNGPIVLGWKGCVEYFKFAHDPTDETFLFGPLALNGE